MTFIITTTATTAMSNFQNNIPLHLIHQITVYHNLTTPSTPDPAKLAKLGQIAKIYTITIPVLLVVCVFSILANSFILVAVECLQIRVKSPLLTLTLSLTASDAWVALVMAISFVVNSYLDKVGGERYQNVSCILLAFEAFRMGAMITSVLHLLVLALNHYVGILRPLHYNTTMTPEITLVSIVILWLVPPAGLLISFAVIPNDGFLSDRCKNPIFYFSYTFRLPVALLVIVPLVAMMAIYIHIFIMIYRSQRNIEVSARPPHMQRKTKAIVTTLLVLGTFGLGWLPAVVKFVLICNDCIFTRADLDSWSPENKISQGIVGNCLILLKCLLDPIIYAARIREINLGLKAMYWTRCGMKKMCGMNRSRTLRMTLSYASRQQSAHFASFHSRSGSRRNQNSFAGSKSQIEKAPLARSKSAQSPRKNSFSLGNNPNPSHISIRLSRPGRPTSCNSKEQRQRTSPPSDSSGKLRRPTRATAAYTPARQQHVVTACNNDSRA